MRRFGWLIAIAIVLVANGVALLGAAWNRGGVPEASVVLTERELPLVRLDEDNTGTALRLVWNGGRRAQDWLDVPTLEQLGFDCSVPPDAPTAADHYREQPGRQAWVVLEYEGQAYRDRLAASETEKQRESVEQESRLYAIEVGRDPGALRQRYPERDRFIVLPAVIDVRWEPESGADDEPRAARIEGYIAWSAVSRVHVSRRHAELFAGLPDDGRPRYAVTLNFGRRYEPWIAGVRPLEPPAEPSVTAD